MSDDSSARITHAVATALEMLPDAEAAQKIETHGRWMLAQVMQEVSPCDLELREVLGLLAILGPAHNRKLELAGPWHPLGGPVSCIIDPVTGHRWSIPDDPASDLG